MSSADNLPAARLLMSENIEIEADEIAKVRTLEDFDLRMLLSEIHEHGWPTARSTLAMMPTPRDPSASIRG